MKYPITVVQFAARRLGELYWLAPPGWEIVSKKRTLLGFYLPPYRRILRKDGAVHLKVIRTKHSIRLPRRAQPWWKGEPTPYWVRRYDGF